MSRLLLSLFLLGSFAGLASADGVKLERTAHTVKIRSFRANGAVHRRSTMHVQVESSQPDSHITIERQARSELAEVPAKIDDVAHLETLGQKVVRWKTQLQFTTNNISKANPHHEVIHDDKLVMWPNARFRAKAVTRDGQEIDVPTAVVGGLGQQTEQHFNPITNQAESVYIKGTAMKGARAWSVPENLYVSEAATDPKMVAEGEQHLALAAQKKQLLEKNQFDLKAAQDALGKATDATQKSTLNTEVNRLITENNALTPEIQKLETDGKTLVTEGNRSIVRVASIGGLPVHTPITLTNQRLTAENTGKKSISTTSSATSGSMHAELEGLPRDRMWIQAFFNQGDTSHSTHSIEFRVPTGDAKPAFEMGGRKYYKLEIERVEQNNVAPN